MLRLFEFLASICLILDFGLKLKILGLLTVNQVKLLEAETSARDFLKANNSRGLTVLMAGPCVFFLCLIIICAFRQC